MNKKATNLLSDDFIVDGVRLTRPFRIRRLGHFGVNVRDPEISKDFYVRLLGFALSDKLDLTGRLAEEDLLKHGPRIGYFARHGTEHHSFVFFPRRALAALYGFPSEFPEVTTNQVTWQVGSLREVVEGHRWFSAKGTRIHRAGRDTPGSNWHTYPFDVDGHVNELFYGIEQIGWDGYSKPVAMHEIRYKAPPELPHRSEAAEVSGSMDSGIPITDGWRHQSDDAECFDVGGVQLARPFKINRIGPVRLFVDDVEKSLGFYRDELGLTITEEVVWKEHRCVFLRANTEHHSLALYPKALRSQLGLHPGTTLFSFGLQVGGYQQLKDAVQFLLEQGVEIKYLPYELFPGIDYCAFAIDPDGHAMQLYYYMEQVGWDGCPRPKSERAVIDNNNWPETVPLKSDTWMGETYFGPLG